MSEISGDYHTFQSSACIYAGKNTPKEDESFFPNRTKLDVGKKTFYLGYLFAPYKHLQLVVDRMLQKAIYM